MFDKEFTQATKQLAKLRDIERRKKSEYLHAATHVLDTEIYIEKILKNRNKLSKTLRKKK